VARRRKYFPSFLLFIVGAFCGQYLQPKLDWFLEHWTGNFIVFVPQIGPELTGS
jgi:hypothetical protein